MVDLPLLKVLVPRLNANEDSGIRVRWMVETGKSVVKGQPICELDSIKAAVECLAEGEGYLHHAVATGSTVCVQDLLAWITPTPDPPDAAAVPRQARAPTTESASGPLISGKARKLAAQLGIDLESFRGMPVVREADVRRIADNPEDGS